MGKGVARGLTYSVNLSLQKQQTLLLRFRWSSSVGAGIEQGVVKSAVGRDSYMDENNFYLAYKETIAASEDPWITTTVIMVIMSRTCMDKRNNTRYCTSYRIINCIHQNALFGVFCLFSLKKQVFNLA